MREQLTKKETCALQKWKQGLNTATKKVQIFKKKKKIATVAPKLFMEIWGIFFLPLLHSTAGSQNPSWTFLQK